MNMLHTPNKIITVEPLRGELMELKELVDAICETRSEICDVLDKLRTGAKNTKEAAKNI